MADAYTKSLLHFNGADTSTTFTDELGKAWTVGGNAQIDTAQSKFGGASGLFDGTGDYIHITAASDSDFAFGSGDFTIELWYRQNASGVFVLYDSRPSGGGSLYPTIYVNSGVIRYYAAAADRITGTTSVASGWHHICVARSGTSTKLFIDGTQDGSTYTDTNSYLNGTSRPIVGAGYNAANSVNGWLDELRVSKGIARWTTNFTPPTEQYGSGLNAQVMIFS